MSDNDKVGQRKVKKNIRPCKNKILPKNTSLPENISNSGPSSESTSLSSEYTSLSSEYVVPRPMQAISLKKHVGLSENVYPSTRSQYFVLPAGGMHFAIPDLNFKVDHFEDKSGTSACRPISKDELSYSFPQSCQRLSYDANIKSEDNYDLQSEMAKERPSQNREKKLPYIVELTAGPGQVKDGSLKNRHPSPSETLFATASLLKSYFTLSQNISESVDKSEPDNDETVKDKMLGMWNSVKYGLSANLKTNFSRETPICLLGKIYHRSIKEDQAFDRFKGGNHSNMEGFKKDFRSIAWFTYRKKFPCLPESSLTTDCGWGCMIRSGQMIMAAALARHFLPPGWRYNSVDDGPEASIHRQIMKWFCDIPSKLSPFSLHNLILSGHKMNKKAGNWYGPSCVAHMFKEVLVDAPKEIPSLEHLTIYVAQDGAVYIQDVLDLCSAKKCICTKPDPKKFKTNNYSKDPFKVTQPIITKDSESNSSCQGLSISTLSSSLTSEPYCVINCDKGRNSYSELDTESSISSFEIEHISLEENIFPINLFVDSNRETYNRITLMTDKKSSTKNGNILDDEICNFCQGWRSCLILIPVRLGGSCVNPIYYDVIYSLLVNNLCIGIIGGRPKHSLYFVGFQEDSLVHLDPHFSQEAVAFDDPEFPLSSFHCSSPKKISISKMDPSATIGFYCHTQSQFFRLIQEAKQIATAKDGSMDSPIFEFLDGKCPDMKGWLDRALSDETEVFEASTSQTESLEASDVLVFDEIEISP